MLLKKGMLICCFGGIFIFQSAFAASCSTDVQQMYSQINSNNYLSFASCQPITAVSNVSATTNGNCTGTCYDGPSDSFSCTWQTGNWGDTLTC